ncbi:Prohead protease [uncultured Caudovirales phage]|uniref:Prohead protease n=1 Tax=uncultured Caudovirales phage TaxID=2100421 RepID=A0A6J7X314_9CAUD|nr:Prohead protease [uncultured Caudovirales phage]CAB4155965.1 Prohead protease [uncultured Caudovirales phage]CAB4160268.1 Prohead protease [uncultured Caudovirales phage]CAB4164692.1 Prohead protease [uncultured Caudovirales phage]CAB4171904.1 Prohead protease [uncultured Caudovirales phage]
MSTTMTETQQYKALQGQFNIDEAQGVVECFVAGIGNKDSVGDIIVPGAFTDSLKRRKPRVVWGHNWNEPIGKVLEMYEVPPSDPRLPMKMRAAGIGGLYAKVQFNLKSERGRQAFADVAFFGEEQEWSIGYKTLDADFDPQRQANVLKKVELYEASPVLHGANQLTGTISIKSFEGNDSKGHMRDENGNITEAGRSLLARFMASNMQRNKPQVEAKPEQDDDAIDAPMPNMSREANLPLALAKKFGGAVRVRESDANSVIFDHRVEGEGIMTMRVSYHYENGQFMIGEATRVKPQVVYINVDGDKPSGSDAERRYEDRYNLEADPQVPAGVKPKSPEKADPLGGIIPQELVTGDILHGRGPRRGNLEKLLRYWRPIMKKPGGFRRCRVILANHPELFPLSNICAWLHHETTGLWPNEGCHHPTMKNCRGKLKKNNWNDSQFNERLTSLIKPGKSLENLSEEEVKSIFDLLDSEEKGYEMMEQLATRLADDQNPEDEEMKLEDIEFENEDEANEKAGDALKQFMNDEPDFINYMADKKNWVIEGEDDNGQMMEMPYPDSDDDDCGCGGGGKDPKQMMGMLMAAIAELMGKDADEDIEVKAGRVISSRNMTKLQNAFNLLKEVLSSGGVASEIEAKSLSLDEKETLMISSAEHSLYEVKELLDPILDYYQIKSEVTEDGVMVEIDGVEDEAFDALLNIMDSM